MATPKDRDQKNTIHLFIFSLFHFFVKKEIYSLNPAMEYRLFRQGSKIPMQRRRVKRVWLTHVMTWAVSAYAGPRRPMCRLMGVPASVHMYTEWRATSNCTDVHACSSDTIAVSTLQGRSLESWLVVISMDLNVMWWVDASRPIDAGMARTAKRLPFPIRRELEIS